MCIDVDPVWSYGMCWKDCCRESVCGVCVCEGNSAAVGEEEGLSEWRECREGFEREEREPKCECE